MQQLEHALQPRGSLGVSVIGLAAGDQPSTACRGASVRGRPAVRRHRPHLDRISERRAGAVRLHAPRRPRHQPDLRRTIGREERSRPPILLDARAEVSHGSPLGRREGRAATRRSRRKYGRRYRLGLDEAVSARVEHVALSRGGRHARRGGADGAARGEQEVDARRQLGGALAQRQGLRGGVRGHQTSRAARLDGAARPVEPIGVRDAAGRHRERRGRDGIGRPAADRLSVDEAVLERVERHRHTRRGAHQRGARAAGQVHGVVRCLEEQPLLRVHRARLAARDAKRRSVEPVGVQQEGASTHPRRHQLRIARQAHLRRVPPGQRHLANQISPRPERAHKCRYRPQALRGVGTAAAEQHKPTSGWASGHTAKRPAR
eukprot:scaffold4605_cov105-Isochrysis_galbana.AAC.4